MSDISPDVLALIREIRKERKNSNELVQKCFEMLSKSREDIRQIITTLGDKKDESRRDKV